MWKGIVSEKGSAIIRIMKEEIRVSLENISSKQETVFQKINGPDDYLEVIQTLRNGSEQIGSEERLGWLKSRLAVLFLSGISLTAVGCGNEQGEEPEQSQTSTQVESENNKWVETKAQNIFQKAVFRWFNSENGDEIAHVGGDIYIRLTPEQADQLEKFAEERLQEIMSLNISEKAKERRILALPNNLRDMIIMTGVRMLFDDLPEDVKGYDLRRQNIRKGGDTGNDYPVDF